MNYYMVKTSWDGDTYSYHLYKNGEKIESFWWYEDAMKRIDELRRKEAEKLPKIKASDFCGFFGFTLHKEHGTIEFGSDEYEYVATDDQGSFQNRYVENVSDLVDSFSALLKDYIDDDLEERGFRYTTSADEVLPEYYEQAQGWCENNLSMRDGDPVYAVVCALATMGATIVDDLAA